ncbi:MAG: D-Ala-D-Ala carboxypeptidase family metallohydrolase [Magnetococcus sp. WYHC-3]
MATVNPDQRLGTNFSLGELLRSQTAERDALLYAQQMSPPEEVLWALGNLVEFTLQPAREGLRYPILVSSGFRCPALNALVKGSPNSQHMLGQAADVFLPTAFLNSLDPFHTQFRQEIRRWITEATGKAPRGNISANFYLFAYLVLNRERFRIDQIIHEFGEGPGRPGWVHVSSRREGSGRSQGRITLVSRDTTLANVEVPVALSWGT